MSMLLTWVGRASSVDSDGGGGVTLQFIIVSPSPGVLYLQNINQWTATGSYSDASTADITNNVTWTVSDPAVSIVSSTGLVTIESAGKIWGANVGVTATLAPGTPGTGTIMCIASDSGSVSPRMPQQNDHWQALGLSPWGSWWGFQEASGSDFFIGSGSDNFALTASAGGGQGILYQQATRGNVWTRSAVSITGTLSPDTRIYATASVGPNYQTTSVAYLGYIETGEMPGSCPIFGGISSKIIDRHMVVSAVGGPRRGQLDLRVGNTGLKQLIGNNMRFDDRVHPFLLIRNAATSEVRCYTDTCVSFSGSFSPSADGEKGFGGNTLAGSTIPSASLLWMAMATGSIVERLCDYSASADFLTRLGWNVEWKTCPIDSGSIKCPWLPHHWTEIGYPEWKAVWNLQEASGTSPSTLATVSIDHKALDLQGTVGPGSVEGWRRQAHRVANNTDASLSRANNKNGSDLSKWRWNQTGSMAILCYLSASATSGTDPRTVVGQAAAITDSPPVNFMSYFGSDGKPVILCAGSSATGSVSIMDNRAHPWLMVYDSPQQRVKLFTDREIVSAPFSALVAAVTGVLYVGKNPAGTTSAAFSALYLAFATGSVAEALSDDAAGTSFLRALGWTVPLTSITNSPSPAVQYQT